MFNRGFLELWFILEGSNIPDRFENVDRLLKKTQNIGRIDIDPVLFLEVYGIWR